MNVISNNIYISDDTVGHVLQSNQNIFCQKKGTSTDICISNFVFKYLADGRTHFPPWEVACLQVEFNELIAHRRGRQDTEIREEQSNQRRGGVVDPGVLLC